MQLPRRLLDASTDRPAAVDDAHLHPRLGPGGGGPRTRPRGGGAGAEGGRARPARTFVRATDTTQAPPAASHDFATFTSSAAAASDFDAPGNEWLWTSEGLRWSASHAKRSTGFPSTVTVDAVGMWQSWHSRKR